MYQYLNPGIPVADFPWNSSMKTAALPYAGLSAVNRNTAPGKVPSAEKPAVKESAVHAKRTGKIECQTCKRRKYQDGSSECNVSFKSASHISPAEAGIKVRAHESEHVANAYKKAEQKGGKVVQASVAIHTAICPECGRVYISGGTTTTRIQYPHEEFAYQKNLKSLQKEAATGNHIDCQA